MKRLADQTYFSNERNNIILLLILFLLAACVSQNDQDISDKSCIPKMVVETHKDTLRVGEVFEARISLSDTSYLTVFDSSEGKNVRFHPVFKMNDSLIQDNFSNYFIVRDTVDSEIVYEEFPNYREINVSVIFPHPIEGEGTVELSKLVSYIVIKSNETTFVNEAQRY